MLALLHPESSTSASMALRAAGASYDAFAEQLATLPADYVDRGYTLRSPAEARVVTPEAREFLGRAEGIAIGHGSAKARPEHLLLSLLWDTVNPVPIAILARLGASREAIVTELNQFDITLPTVELPAISTRLEFRPVSADELDRARAELERAGVGYRIGYRGEQTFLGVAQGTSNAAEDPPHHQ